MEERCFAHDVPFGRVQSLDEAIADPQVAHNKTLEQHSLPKVGKYTACRQVTSAAHRRRCFLNLRAGVDREGGKVRGRRGRKGKWRVLWRAGVKGKGGRGAPQHPLSGAGSLFGFFAMLVLFHLVSLWLITDVPSR